MEHIYIRQEDLDDYIFESLVRGGYVPSDSDTQVIAEIVFDYLIDMGMPMDGE